MSNMLKQAIVDAEALREAALKKAEAAVVEKYSDQIKEAVESLLEQPEEEDPLAMPGEEPEAEEEEYPEPTPAFTAGERMCPGTEQEEEMVFDLGDLEKQVAAAETSMGAGGPAPGIESHEDLTADVLATPADKSEEIEFKLDDIADKLGMLLSQELGTDRIDQQADDLRNIGMGNRSYPTLEEGIDEEVLEELVERLKVDIEPAKSGFSGLPYNELKVAEEQVLAKEQDTEVKEERDALRKAVEKLSEQNRSLKKEQKENKKHLSQLTNIVKKYQVKLDETNVSNAKLLYTNKALISNSLNERQKIEMAETISRANSVEEAKLIFETLQKSAMGRTSSTRRHPESLSEAVQRNSSTVLPRRKKVEKANPAASRWKLLAGIEDK